MDECALFVGSQHVEVLSPVPDLRWAREAIVPGIRIEGGTHIEKEDTTEVVNDLFCVS
jgi:hypothetical protein